MKTAISLPDDLFEQAERLAERAKVSRSEVYRNALEEYLARHDPDTVRTMMDQALAQIDGKSEELVRAAAVEVLKRTEW